MIYIKLKFISKTSIEFSFCLIMDKKGIVVVSIFQTVTVDEDETSIKHSEVNSWRVRGAPISSERNILVIDVQPVVHLDNAEKEDIFFNHFGSVATNDEIIENVKNQILIGFTVIIKTIREGKEISNYVAEFD